MKENQVSLTAQITAYIRAYHARHHSPKIFDDFLAYQLIPDEQRTTIEQSLPNFLKYFDPEQAALCPDQATALEWVMRNMLNVSTSICRARYTEDSLETALTEGVRQYVILGAGLDTFAFRRPEMVNRLEVFEVDHPATQAFKRSRISELGWAQPKQLHFIPLDFTKEELPAALKRSSYDPQTLSFFSWLGVSYYLTRDTVLATLRAFAEVAPAGSKIIFDYLDTDAFVPERMAKNAQILHQVGERIGEPLKAGFDPSKLAGDLANLGLRLQENLSPADIDRRYFEGHTDGHHASEHFNFACAVVC